MLLFRSMSVYNVCAFLKHVSSASPSEASRTFLIVRMRKWSRSAKFYRNLLT